MLRLIRTEIIENVDFRIDTSPLIIPYTSESGDNFCRNILIYGDNHFEGNENLTVTFTPLTRGAVFAGTSEYVLVIIDDGDSK